MPQIGKPGGQYPPGQYPGGSGSQVVTVESAAALGTFPYVTGARSRTYAAGASHIETALPPANRGDLYLSIVAFSSASGAIGVQAPSGWSIQATAVQGSTNLLVVVYARKATGSDTEVNFATSQSDALAISHTYVIASWSNRDLGAVDGDGVESSSATGTSVSPDPPSLAPSWGSRTTLWFSVAARADTTAVDDVSASPALYVDNELSTDTGTGPGLGLVTSWRQVEAASENPGAYTLAGSEDWAALTLAIEPAPIVRVGSMTRTTNRRLVIIGERVFEVRSALELEMLRQEYALIQPAEVTPKPAIEQTVQVEMERTVIPQTLPTKTIAMPSTNTGLRQLARKAL